MQQQAVNVVNDDTWSCSYDVAAVGSIPASGLLYFSPFVVQINEQHSHLGGRGRGGLLFGVSRRVRVE
jgi:hypothetical protein